MVDKLVEQIKENKERRAALIALRQELKTSAGKDALQKITGGKMDFLMKCLVDEDAKVRKNAALILGELHCQDALEVLMDAYEAEEQMFVRADYVKAMGMMECASYVAQFREKLNELLSQPMEENQKKHIQNEIREIRNLLLEHGDVKRHTFNGYNRLNDLILTTDRGMGSYTAEQIKNGKTKVLQGGVRVQTADMDEILQIRTFREILMPLDTTLPCEVDQAAKSLMESELMKILTENHREPGPFYFRLGISDKQPLDVRSAYAKKLAAKMEEVSGQQLLNSTSHYEVEIRLIQNKEGTYGTFLKLYTIPDNRFAYRRYHVSASIQPYRAALMMEIAKPYLKEYAQILDPFCGVGTMLVERNYQMPGRDTYGLDIFREAIEKAKVNAKIAKMHINYVNRDYFTFRHEYVFDEIITNMPDTRKLDHAEEDAFYRKFFDKSASLLAPGGLLFLYTKEKAMIKKHLRLREEYKLLKEQVFPGKEETFFFIIRYK